MTMLQLSNFTALDAHEVVKGITGTKNLFNKDIKKRVKDGSIFCLRSKVKGLRSLLPPHSSLLPFPPSLKERGWG